MAGDKAVDEDRCAFREEMTKINVDYLEICRPDYVIDVRFEW